MDSSFQELETCLSVDLHPSKLRNIAGSVREQLDTLLLTYREELHGVVLSYKDDRIVNKSALVHSFFPYFHIDATAKLQLLNLHPGQHLVGTVHKVGSDYVGLLVLGAFNAAIYKQDMKGHFRHDKQGGYWVSTKDIGHKLKHGSQVRFQIKGIEKQASHFIIVGDLQQDGCGAVERCVPSYRPNKGHANMAQNEIAAAATGAQPNSLVGILSKISTHSAAATGQLAVEDAEGAGDGPNGHAAASETSLAKKVKKRKRKEDRGGRSGHAEPEQAGADEEQVLGRDLGAAEDLEEAPVSEASEKKKTKKKKKKDKGNKRKDKDGVADYVHNVQAGEQGGEVAVDHAVTHGKKKKKKKRDKAGKEGTS